MNSPRTGIQTSRMAPAALLVAMLTGCTVGPRYEPPAPPSAATYTVEPQAESTVAAPGPGSVAQTFNTNADIPAQWWTLFQSPQLDLMVREALAHSPTLAQALARVNQAQEESNAHTGETKYPTVTANGSITRQQVDLASLGVPVPSPPPFTLLNGSVAVSYTLDLFGANRRLIEGLNAQVAYEECELQGARLMLAGNVVSTAIRQAQLSKQLETTRHMLALQEQTLHVTEQRHGAGGVSEYDLRSQRTALAQAQASLPPLEQQLDLVNHQLAVLMGKAPGEGRVEKIDLDSLNLPQDLPLSLPSTLARQRPDIRAAETLLHQASANVGLAKANLYPQIVLSASAGAIATDFANGGPLWSVGASLAQPLFKGGSLRAERRKAAAAYEEAGSAYQQTLLQAFREVADVLRSIQHDAEALRARNEAAAQAEGAYQVASRRYAAGGISQIALLDAQRQQLQTAMDRSVCQAARCADSATLFQALGGGWWNENRSGLTNATPQRR